MLENLKEKNPEITFHTTADKKFKKYGRVLNYNTTQLGHQPAVKNSTYFPFANFSSSSCLFIFANCSITGTSLLFVINYALIIT